MLADSATELRATLTLPDTSDGRDVRELVRTGVFRGFSLEFRASTEDWSGDRRMISKATLQGFAVVDDPAYVGATVHEKREAEERMYERQARGTRDP